MEKQNMMKTPFKPAVLALFLALAASSSAAEAESLARLERALQAVVAFEYGNDAAPLNQVEQIVVAAVKNPAERAAIEERLLHILLDSPATRDAKEFVCRQLFLIGTARSVSALESMLTDESLAHIARYTLGRIDAPEASAALRRALNNTSGKLQIGILSTLAQPRHRAALPDILKLLDSSDPDLKEAAVAAVGSIGGTSAVKALETLRAKAPEELQPAIRDALLASADLFLAEGQAGAAASIFKKFHALGQPKHIRIAALRGLVEAGGSDAAPILIEAIKDSDAELAASAIQFARDLKGAQLSQQLGQLIPSLDPEAQALLVRALGDRGDAGAASTIIAAVTSEHEPVRVAALESLGRVGQVSAVETLARIAATTSGNEQRAARASLIELSGAEIIPAMIRLLSSGESKIRIELIRTLAIRRANAALSELFKLARDEDATVRRESIEALGSLAAETDAPALVALVISPKEARDRASLEEAMASLFRRVGDANKRAAIVLSALASAPVEAKPSLIRLLGLAATPGALNAVRTALQDDDSSIRDAARRTLIEWPDAAPAEDLLKMAQNAPERSHKVLALRGYVRMAGLTENPTAMYVRAMDLAERPEDKKLVLAGLGTAQSFEALQLAEIYLEDEALQAEAGLAIAQIAGRVRQSHPAETRAALRKTVAILKEGRIRQQAQDVLNELDQFEGYILTWMMAGPFQEKGKESRAIFDAVFPPEQPDAPNVKWRPLKNGAGSWDINLVSAFGQHDHAAAYLRTRVWAPATRDARLELGSDDGIKVFLNGKLVHANYTHRGLAPRQDQSDVKLQQGWNDLLVKVVNHSGPWAFCARLRNPDGSALEELKFEAK
jgi:HEAT repeat protein